MSLESLTGRAYGPFQFELSAAKVADYVAATGDDAPRWTEYAPPAYAGAVLFKAAPAFLFDPEVATHARLLIHGEQFFEWPQPWRIGSQLTVRGLVYRVRERNGVTFATFVMEASDEEDRQVLAAKSLFLMSSDSPPGGEASERSEPLPDERGPNEQGRSGEFPSVDGSFVTLSKSASRADLVRYAAASEDFNPMHWDHDRAVAAGVGGVICHGLLMAAWATQPAAGAIDRPDPLAEARFRFRLPLPPGVPTAVVSSVTKVDGGLASVKAAVCSQDGDHMVATLLARTGDA